ncbi:MAG: circularly permuted type 2 ATP-grasp protein, partial [Casimicrobium sp.]
MTQPLVPTHHSSALAIDGAFVSSLMRGHIDSNRAGKMLFDDRGLAPHWQTFFEQALNANHGLRSGFDSNDQSDDVEAFRARLVELNASVQRRIADNGVTYNVYSDASSQSRPWSLDVLPMIVPEHEWQTIERGVLQRVRLLNDVLADVYGKQTLLKRGLLPAAIVQGHPGYRRTAHGIAPRGGTHLHIVGFDLARGNDGHWWIISQRTD